MDEALGQLRARMERFSPDGRSPQAAMCAAIEQMARFEDMRLLSIEHQAAKLLADQLARYAQYESIEAMFDIAPWLSALSHRLDESAKSHLVIPPDHEYEFDAQEQASWVLRGFGHQISAYIHRNPPARNDETQFQLEMRLWVDEPKAQLFAWQGKPFWGEHKDLLERPLMFVNGEDQEAVIRTTVERAALAIAIAMRNRAAARTGAATSAKPAIGP